MPAIYATDYIHTSSKQTLKFEGVSGTVLEGRANAISYNGIRINNVSWQTSALSLLTFNVSVDVLGGAIRNTSQLYAKGNISVSLFGANKIKAENTTLFAPAKTLFAQLRLPVNITASGRFKLDIDEFVYDQGCIALQGKGNWLQASVNLNDRPVDFGSFDADLSCKSPNFALQIKPENGITLAADIEFDANGKYGAKGTFVIPENYPMEIQQGARIFAARDAQGVYQLNIPFR